MRPLLLPKHILQDKHYIIKKKKSTKTPLKVELKIAIINKDCMVSVSKLNDNDDYTIVKLSSQYSM